MRQDYQQNARPYFPFNRQNIVDSRPFPSHPMGRFVNGRRSMSPVSRGRSFPDFGDVQKARFGGTRFDYRRSSEDLQRQNAADDDFKRIHFTNGDKAMIQPSWTVGTKRSISPASRNSNQNGPPMKRWHPISSVAAEAAAVRRPVFYKKHFENTAESTHRSASPVTRKPHSWPSPGPSTVVGQDPPTGNPALNDEDRALGVPGAPRQVQVNALNRELWDVRRQITALKAREDTIAQGLRDLSAPVPVNPAELPTGLTPEERLMSMELELKCTFQVSCNTSLTATFFAVL
jgi:hypothetical protein